MGSRKKKTAAVQAPLPAAVRRPKLSELQHPGFVAGATACPHCGRPFMVESNLADHVSRSHGSNSEPIGAVVAPVS